MSFSQHRRVSEQLFARGGEGGDVCERAAEGTITRPAVTRPLCRVVCTHCVCQQLPALTACSPEALPAREWQISCGHLVIFSPKDSRHRRGEEYQGQKWNIAKSMVCVCWCPQKNPKKPKKLMWPAYLKSMLTIRQLDISSLAWKTLIQTINPDLHCKEALLIFMWKIEGDSS